MNTINRILNFINNIDSDKLMDVLMAISVVLFFSLISSVISFLVVKIFKLKSKHFGEMRKNPWYIAIKNIFICIGVYLAIDTLNLSQEVNEIFIKVYRIVLILVVSKCIANFCNPKSKIFARIKENDKFSKDQTMLNFVSKITKTCIYIIAIFLIISELGYDLSGIITGLGLGGVILALAAQDIAKNLFGGFAILTDKPFVIGDYIEIGKYAGNVEDITFRSTRIRTIENTVITIPNSVLSNESIINWSRISKRRLEISINVPLETDSTKITRISEKLKLVLGECEHVIEDSVIVTCNEIEDNKIKIWVYLYTDITELTQYLLFKNEINLTALKVIETEKIKLAYPGNNIYVK